MAAGARRGAGRLLALWAGLLVLGVAGGLIVEGNAFDGRLVRGLAGDRSAGLTAAARLATDLGGGWLDLIFAAAVLGLLMAGRRGDAGSVLLAGGGAILLTNLIKLVLERPRPAGGGLVAVASSSWPSGHASSSVAVYGALAVIAARVAAPGARRAAIWWTLAVLTGAVGVSRVYLGVHYPSDVLAGWLLGGCWLVGILRVLAPSPTAGRTALPSPGAG